MLEVDDTLQLYFLCAHPSLTPSSAVALTLRAVGGLTTRQIAEAYLVPEAATAQRISRAKRTVSGVRFDQAGDVDLAAEAIRLTRRLSASIDHPEVAGLIAEGVETLRAALAHDRLGEFQAQAAIAALHADAPTAGETDWVQIVEWYDELARLTGSPVVRLNRAVAVGEADGPRADLAERAHLTRQAARLNALKK